MNVGRVTGSNPYEELHKPKNTKPSTVSRHAKLKTHTSPSNPSSSSSDHDPQWHPPTQRLTSFMKIVSLVLIWITINLLMPNSLIAPRSIHTRRWCDRLFKFLVPHGWEREREINGKKMIFFLYFRISFFSFTIYF